MTGVSIATPDHNPGGTNQSGQGQRQSEPDWTDAGGADVRQRVSWRVIALVLTLVGLLLWNLWLTRTLVANPPPRVVAVSLKTLVGDYMRESARRSGISQQQLGFEVQLYAVALDAAVEEMTRDGRIVLVREAMVGTSQTDVTEELRGLAKAKFEALMAAQAAHVDRVPIPAGGR